MFFLTKTFSAILETECLFKYSPKVIFTNDIGFSKRKGRHTIIHGGLCAFVRVAYSAITVYCKWTELLNGSCVQIQLPVWPSMPRITIPGELFSALKLQVIDVWFIPLYSYTHRPQELYRNSQVAKKTGCTWGLTLKQLNQSWLKVSQLILCNSPILVAVGVQLRTPYWFTMT